ncbi:methyltransferase [Gordonia iterans]
MTRRLEPTPGMVEPAPMPRRPGPSPMYDDLLPASLAGSRLVLASRSALDRVQHDPLVPEGTEEEAQDYERHHRPGTRNVYRPQADTALLIRALGDVDLTGRRALDLCTGSGVIAAAAAAGGARSVVAVDSCPHAVAAARALRTGPEWAAVHSTVAEFADAEGFDVVTCNPPYVPAPGGAAGPLPGGPAHAWDAGPDGREVLDVLCARAADLVAPGGILLLVQSTLADPDATRRLLEHNGFRVTEAGRGRIPFGPVLRSRRDWLIRSGRVRPGQRWETLTVLRARRDPIPAAVR